MVADSTSAASTASRSESDSHDTPVAQPPRLKYACEACHASKVRCSGRQPCNRCTTNGWDCVYKLAARIGKPKGSRNKSTIKRLQLEAEQQAVREGRTSPGGSMPVCSPPPYPHIAAESGGAAFSSPFGAPSLSPGSSTQDYFWPSDASMWPHSPDSLRTTSLPSQTVSSPDGQWAALVEGGGPGSSRSLSDAATGVAGLGIPQWPAGYSVSGESQGTVVTSTMQELFTGGPAFSYSMAEMPGSAFMPHTAAYDHEALGSPPLLMDESRQPSPFRNWTSTEGATPALPSTPPAGPGTCSCKQTLSWQLSRLDQLRKAITPSTTVGGFLNETDEMRQAIGLHLGCQNCDKDAAGVSLVTTAFANFTHVLLLIIRSVADPIAQALRQDSYNWLSATPGDAGMGADQLGVHKMEAKLMIDEWVQTCERSLQIIRTLSVAVEPAPAAGMAPQAVETGEKGQANAATIPWSGADPSSVQEMLWRVKQSLTNLA